MSWIPGGPFRFFRDRSPPVKVALYYTIAAGTWILLSDRVLSFFVRDAERLSELQTVKGWIFVLVSALLLYFLVRHFLRAVHRREELLQASEERFRSIFTNAGAGVVILSPAEEILDANSAFCRMLGYGHKELVGKNLLDLTHPDDRSRAEKAIRDLLAGQDRALDFDERFLTGEGRVIWGHSSMTCMIGRENEAPYCIGLVQDITASKRAEEELRETNRQLDAFVYTVSHDLRSPLTPILGFTEMLRQKCLERHDVESDRVLAEIEEQGKKMLALLEDLLCLARVGKIECPLEPESTASVLCQSLGDLALCIQEAGTEVRVVEPLPPIGIPATLLGQVFRNLIANALYYAGKSGGPVEVGGNRRHDRVRLFVRDHGPGIPAEERMRIFDPFFRGSTGRHLEGTGIGLAIVRKIARLYHGEVRVEETPGGGATFWVTMVDECTPMLAADAGAAAEDG